MKVLLNKEYGAYAPGDIIECDPEYRLFMRQIGTIMDEKAVGNSPQNKAEKPPLNKSELCNTPIH